MKALAAADVADLVGIPWAADGRDAGRGLSCYGLAREVYRRAGVEIPALWVPAADGSQQPQCAADVLASLHTFWEPLDGPAPMALVNLPSPWCEAGGHCAVLLTEGAVIHALPKTGVICHPFARIAARALAFYRLRAPTPPGGGPFVDGPCGYDPAVHDRVVPDPATRCGPFPRLDA